MDGEEKLTDGLMAYPINREEILEFRAIEAEMQLIRLQAETQMTPLASRRNEMLSGWEEKYGVNRQSMRIDIPGGRLLCIETTEPPQ